MTDNEQRLLAGLRALADGETGPPPRLEAALLKRLRRRRVFSWPLGLEVLAAAAILGIALYQRPKPVEAAFMAIPYAAPIGVYERTDLVRVNIPVSALAQWGLPVAAFNPDQRIDADVVLGEDGLARAVRLVGNE